jgi:DNA recombination protein RmuC
MTTTLIVLVVLGFAVGFAVAWALASARARTRAEELLRELESARAAQESAAAELRKQVETLREDLSLSRARFEEEQARRTTAETALTKTQENLEEQKKAFEEAKAKLTDVFRSLASEALSSSTQEFLKLAGTKFEVLQKDATGALAQKQEAIKGLVDPLSEAVKSLHEQLTRVEASRQKDQGEMVQRLQELTQTSQELRKETGSLVTSLRQPQIKGKWGELLLRRALELTGMSAHSDFVEQPTVEGEAGRLRPDLVVHLPGGRHIVIDAKVPQEAFLKALSARSQDDYWAAMAEHASLVRNHVNQLASRRYWEQFSPSPEFVVLFLPAESFFSAALEQDHKLIEDAMEKKVVLASPTTLLALLRAVEYGWRQEDAWKNAEKIRDLGKELYDRVVNFVEHLADIRTGLDRAIKAYNNAVGSLEARLLPSARKFKALGVTAAEEIPEIEPVEAAPRQLAVPSDEEQA